MNEKQKNTLNALSLTTVVIKKNYSKMGISVYSPTNHKFPRELFSTGQKKRHQVFQIKLQKTIYGLRFVSLSIIVQFK
jgi:hypothetical protein